MTVDQRGCAADAAVPAPHSRDQHVIGDIEVLRAIAVLFTVAQHVGLLLFWTHWEAGPAGRYFALWGGVDLFFCISGYVIFRSLRDQCWVAGSGWRGFCRLALPFWIRRAWRILPTAWLWIALPLLASAFLNRSGVFGPVGANVSDGLAAVLYVANFHWYQCSAAGGGSCNVVSSLLGPYWSLSLEEQFYILLPMALFLLRKKQFVLFIAAAIASQLFLSRPNWDLMWAVRTDGLLLGVAIALWQGGESHAVFEPLFMRRKMVALAVLLVAVFLIAFIPSPMGVVRFSTGLLTLVCGFLVFVASFGRDYIVPAGPVRGLLVALGARSYAIYLVHLPVFVLTREIWFRLAPQGTQFHANYTLRFLLTAAVLLALFVELNFRFIEKPLRARGKRIARRMAQRLTA